MNYEALEDAAWAAHIDAAQNERGTGSQAQAQAGVKGSVRAVVNLLTSWGWAPPTERVRQSSVHGTRSAYQAGCRCRYCTGAALLYDRARHHWNREQGDNKWRPDGSKFDEMGDGESWVS